MKNNEVARPLEPMVQRGTTQSALSGDSPVKNWAGVGIVDYGEEEAAKNSHCY